MHVTTLITEESYVSNPEAVPVIQGDMGKTCQAWVLRMIDMLGRQGVLDGARCAAVGDALAQYFGCEFREIGH